MTVGEWFLLVGMIGSFVFAMLFGVLSAVCLVLSWRQPIGSKRGVEWAAGAFGSFMLFWFMLGAVQEFSWRFW
jgi:hypothetical protein